MLCSGPIKSMSTQKKATNLPRTMKKDSIQADDGDGDRLNSSPSKQRGRVWNHNVSSLVCSMFITFAEHPSATALHKLYLKKFKDRRPRLGPSWNASP